MTSISNDLIKAASNGDDVAFAELVERTAPRVFALLRRLVWKHEEVEDLAQEVFLCMHAHLSKFAMGRPLDPWLCRVAVNLGIDWLRKNAQSNSQSTQLAEETAVPDPSPELLVTRAETRQRLLSIIDLLPRNQKRVLVLRDLHEFPVTEIAGLLNCRESTVRVHLARARHKMRSLIKIHASDLLR